MLGVRRREYPVKDITRSGQSGRNKAQNFGSMEAKRRFSRRRHTDCVRCGEKFNKVGTEKCLLDF